MPPKRSTAKYYLLARELRKESTPSESKLWANLRLLRGYGIPFRRQHAIGNYIVDFCAPRRKLIIEVNGNQHVEQEEYDLGRTAWLESKGYRILRFWNDDVIKDINAVMGVIWEALENK